MQPKPQEGDPTADPLAEPSRWQLLNFCSSVRYKASFVQLPLTLGQKSKCRTEMIGAQPGDLKMESCVVCYKTQPVTTGGRARRRAQDSSSRQCVRVSFLFDFTHAFWLSKWGPVTQSVFSIFFVTFKTKQKNNSSAGLCLIWGKHCFCVFCRGVWIALCWPSEKLQQTHFIIGWK